MSELKRHWEIGCVFGWARIWNVSVGNVTGGGYRRLAIPEFQWLNTVLGNVRNSLPGDYHQIGGQHLPRNLAGFCDHFNRRFDLAARLLRLGWAAVRTPPMPCRIPLFQPSQKTDDPSFVCQRCKHQQHDNTG
jgi:hypothetical protein